MYIHLRKNPSFCLLDKINLIKELRNYIPLSLKEAKDEIEKVLVGQVVRLAFRKESDNFGEFVLSMEKEGVIVEVENNNVSSYKVEMVNGIKGLVTLAIDAQDYQTAKNLIDLLENLK